MYSRVTQLYSYIHSLLYSFSLWFITGCSVWSPVLYSRTLFIYSKGNSLHLLTPNFSASLPRSMTLSDVLGLCSYSCFCFTSQSSASLMHYYYSLTLPSGRWPIGTPVYMSLSLVIPKERRYFLSFFFFFRCFLKIPQKRSWETSDYSILAYIPFLEPVL